eukprot:3638846-Amphidinium_carterae.1
MATAIAQRTVASATNSSSKGPVSTQSLQNPCFFFTKSDVDELLAVGKTLQQRVHIVAARCGRLRLSNPTEATTKGLAAFVSCFQWGPGELPTADQAYNLVLELKQAI